MWREPWTTKLARRAVTVPALWLLAALYIAALPLVLVYAVGYDLVKGRPRLPLTRAHILIAMVMVWHLVGCLGLLGFWLTGALRFRRNPRGWWQWNRKFEAWWGHSVIGIGEAIFGMTMEIRGEQHLRPGPILVLCRHTSIADTMLPLRILEHRHQMIARIVKKRELLWDAPVDAISQRMPRTFLHRGGNPEVDRARLHTLALGMGADDGIWMFPEGTRFSPQKRAQVLAKLRTRNHETAARAEQLQHTLPPRPTGTLALLDACHGADVVFCAHTGLEGANRLENMINGSLLDRKVKVELWRVPAAEIPVGEHARIEWLHEQWLRMDRWVADNQDPDIAALLAR